MRAISMWQPWAQWVALGWKTIETRKHSRFAGLVGERTGIHAAKKWDRWAFSAAHSYMSHDQKLIFMNTPYCDGGIICTVYVEGFMPRLSVLDSEQAMIDCTSAMTGLVFADVERLAELVEIPGRQGIFHVPNELIRTEIDADHL